MLSSSPSIICLDFLCSNFQAISPHGYRDELNLSTIRTNLEMESHEEKLHNMIKASKMAEAKVCIRFQTVTQHSLRILTFLFVLGSFSVSTNSNTPHSCLPHGSFRYLTYLIFPFPCRKLLVARRTRSGIVPALRRKWRAKWVLAPPAPAVTGAPAVPALDTIRTTLCRVLAIRARNPWPR